VGLIALALMLVSLLPLAACQRNAAREKNPLEAAPVDTARVHASDVPTWGYRREISADLDGDQKLERVVIASNVRIGPTGPIWEDGQLWAVYVEGAGGKRELLYGAFVPNGFAEAAVLAPDSDRRRKVLIQERTPQQMRAMEVTYNRGKVRLSSAAYYQLGEWLPGAAALR